MTTLSGIITPSNILTADNTQTLTNKTIDYSSNTITNLPVTAAAGSTGQVQYNNAGAFAAIASGTSGQVLTSAGAGAAPTWSTISSGGGLTITKTFIYSAVSTLTITLPSTPKSFSFFARVALVSSGYLTYELSSNNGSTWTPITRFTNTTVFVTGGFRVENNQDTHRYKHVFRSDSGYSWTYSNIDTGVDGPINQIRITTSGPLIGFNNYNYYYFIQEN